MRAGPIQPEEAAPGDAAGPNAEAQPPAMGHATSLGRSRGRFWLALAARAVVAAALAWAGIAKVIDPGAFAQTVANYRLLPPMLVHPTAILLPWLELTVAAGLLVPRLADGAGLLAVLLLTIFTLATANAWARGLEIACGCFGGGGAETTIGLWQLGRNLLLLLLAVGGWLERTGLARGRGSGEESRREGG